MSRWLRLLLGLACLAAACCWAADSRFQRTVAALSTGQPELQARFANIALLELAEIYLAEADLARGEAGLAEDSGALRAWAGAVDRSGRELADLAASVAEGSPVQLRRYPHEAPAVEIAGRTVVLAHPRPDQQPAYEQAVLERFCVADLCRQLTAEPEGEALPPPVAIAAVAPDWSFSADGATCAYRGLLVSFEGSVNLAMRRELCRELLQEVETLAVEAARQQGHGVRVDWEQLEILSLPGRPGHLVRLNAEGDSLLAALPLLAATPGLPAAVAPWLRGRFAPGGPPDTILRAAGFGWE